MARPPEIREPGLPSEWHDSSLIHFTWDPVKECASAVVSTPDDTRYGQNLWLIEMTGVLRIEMETLGSGEPTESPQPPEAYEIGASRSSEEALRWKKRLRTLGVRGDVLEVCFLSSYLRGWGERSSLEGFTVICRAVRVDYAPKEFKGREFFRPFIPAGREG